MKRVTTNEKVLLRTTERLPVSLGDGERDEARRERDAARAQLAVAQAEVVEVRRVLGKVASDLGSALHDGMPDEQARLNALHRASEATLDALAPWVRR